jgi:predicted nucleic acid-binding protein
VLERCGSRLEDFDVAIAAHAASTDAVLVTHDRALGTRIPDVIVEDWSEPLAIEP